MRIQYNTIKNKLLFDRFYAGKTLFYKKCNNYYYARVSSFDRLFDLLVIGLGIFRPELTQAQENTWSNSREKERHKIKIIQDCVFMGKQMLDERKDEFFQAEVNCSPPYMKSFYIAQNSIEPFIVEILIPLLTLVNNAKDYKWRKISGKKGFWRDYNPDQIHNHEEICIDQNTQTQIIKLS